MITKTCTKCGAEKSIDCFVKNGNDKLYPSCRECKAQYRKENKQKVDEYNRYYRTTYPDKVALINKEYRKNNKEKVKAYSLKYNTEHKDVVAFRNKAYREANKDKIKLLKQQHIANNRDLYAAYTAKRRAIKAQATPSWANDQDISAMYLLASICNDAGLRVEVDHIVPLNSPNVCGLHCESNLQILPATLNNQKSNRYWPDMW
jgi:transcription elongation factor Elf1